MMNKEIRQLENDIVNTLNNSPVNVETKRLLIESILYKLLKEADKVIIAEMQEGENAESTQ